MRKTAYDAAATHFGALAGWLEHLAHPEMHSGPRRLGLGYGAGEIIEARIMGVNTPQSGPVYSDQGSIMREFHGDQFFAHADASHSGQRGRVRGPGESFRRQSFHGRGLGR